MSSGNLYPQSQNQPNLYKAILTLNNKLHQYTQQQQQQQQDFIYYINVNDIFISRRNNPNHVVMDENIAYDDYYIPKKLMDDFLHPTALGYELWAGRIIKELDRILG